MDEIPTKIVQTRHGPMRVLTNDFYITRCLEVLGEYSRAEWELLSQVVKPGMTVVEAGANIGALSVPLARACSPGRFIALEPHPVIFALLRENLDVNGLEAALAVQAAAGDHDGASCVPEADFATTGNFGAFGLSDGGLPVRLLTIDSLKLADLGLLKVDVEGSELAVISGARRTIERCRPVMYLENDRTDAQGALIESASNLGYRLYWHTPLLAETGLFNAPFRSLNMLCIPSERGTQVRDLEQIDPLNWRSPIQGR